MTTKDMETARARLIQHLRHEIRDERVLAVMSRVPRELFVPPQCRHLAYEDEPLPIKEGQTISQPFMVAFMTQALALKGNERVLEVGTGSGYQAAILAELAREVITVERHPALAGEARALLKALGYTNVEVYLAEGNLGWPEEAPYDAVIVTAGAPMVPQALLDQLKDKGRLVVPVGSRHVQDLLLVVKRGEMISRRSLGACRFVPLVGKEAWPEE